jgi:hypothetical protein
MRTILRLGAGLAVLFGPAAAAGLPALSPLSADLGVATLSAGGTVQASGFAAFQPAPARDSVRGSGAATLSAALSREYDSGLVLGLDTVFQLYSDRLSGDNYGNDFVQKVYGRAETGLGNVEFGMNDGAAYALAVIGPAVNGETALDNPNATFFRDPATGRAVIETFTLNSAVEPSLNYAKLSYYTPQLFGVEIGVSYTPSMAKGVLPFLKGGPKTADRQESLWETAVRYRGSLGSFETAFSFAAAFAHADAGMKTAGHQGLTEWAAGAEFSYPLDDDTKISFGGAYRASNAYRFDLLDVRDRGETSSARLSAEWERGPWSFGVEYGDGTADGRLPGSEIGVRGYGAAVGYALSENLALTLGWQDLRYARNGGAFYNDRPRLDLDAVYLHLRFAVE